MRAEPRTQAVPSCAGAPAFGLVLAVPSDRGVS